MKERSWLIWAAPKQGSNQRVKCRNPWQSLVFDKKTHGVCRQASSSPFLDIPSKHARFIIIIIRQKFKKRGFR